MALTTLKEASEGTWGEIWPKSDLLGDCVEEFDGGSVSPSFRLRVEHPQPLRRLLARLVELGEDAAMTPAREPDDGRGVAVLIAVLVDQLVGSDRS